MSNDQQPDLQPDPHPSAPRAGWGAEYDADATATFELPPGGLPLDRGGDPLAAPGHGYQPPEIREPTAPLSTPPATTDPGDTGRWTMPFAYGSQASAADRETPAAAAMGQGVAAALAGSHQGRTGRRPLGEGPTTPLTELPAESEAPVRLPGDALSAEQRFAEPALGVVGGDRWSAPEPEAGPRVAPPGADLLGEEPRQSREPGQVDASRQVDDGGAGGAGGEVMEAGDLDEVFGVDAVESADEGAGEARSSEHPEVSYVLRVNGVDRPVTGAWIGESLLYVLRERLGLAGAKDGCAQGQCGACSVQVDGRLVAACLTPAATAAGSEIRTVEGLGADGVPSDVQRALAAADVQCGFCLPGMAMTVHDLLEGNHAPTELETRQALCGNLCRCSGYRAVLDAVRTVVGERVARAAHAAAAAQVAAETATDATAVTAEGHQQHVPGIPHQAGPAAGGPS